MNKLEQQFSEAFENRGGSVKEIREINAKIVAKIALELAEKAYNVGCSRGSSLYTDTGEDFEDFMKKIL